MAVDRAVGDHPVIGIQLVEQLVAGEHPARSAGKGVEQAQFNRRQVQRHTIKSSAVAGFVDLDARLRHGLQVRAAAQYRFDPGHHLPWAERFADVVIGAQIQPQQAVHFFDPGGDHDDRHRTETAQFLADVQTIPARQHQVEQDQAWRMCANPRHHLKAVAQAMDGVAFER